MAGPDATRIAAEVRAALQRVAGALADARLAPVAAPQQSTAPAVPAPPRQPADSVSLSFEAQEALARLAASDPGETQAAISALLREAAQAQDPEARAALLEQLAQPEWAARAAEVLRTDAGRDLLARTFAPAPEPRATDGEALAQTRAVSAALRILARPDLAATAREALSTEGARAALAQVLARVTAPATPHAEPSPPPASPVGLSPAEPSPQAASSTSLSSAEPSPRQAVLPLPAALSPAESTPPPAPSTSLSPVEPSPPPAPPPARQPAPLSLAEPPPSATPPDGLPRTEPSPPTAAQSPSPRLAPAEPSPQAAPSSGLPRGEADAAAQPVTHQDAEALLSVLARPEMVDAARALFTSPEARAALTAALAEPAPSSPGPAPALSRTDTAILLSILSQPPMADIAREAFSTAEARTILARVLAAPLDSPTATSPQAAAPEADARAVLRILAQPGMADVARDVLSRPEVQARVPDLLAHAETRAAALDLLLEPELRSEMARLMARPEVADAVARLAAESPSAAAQAAVLVQRPETAESYLAALARTGAVSASPPDAWAPRDPAVMLQSLLALLGASGTSAPVSAEEVTAVLASLFAHADAGWIGTAFLPTAQATSGRATQGAKGASSGATASSAQSSATLRALSEALAHLANVAPARATDAARAIALVAQWGAVNTDEVLGELAHRFDTLAGRLALKGGRTPGASEPPPNDSVILSVRFGQMTPAQLGEAVRAFARAGMIVTFIGRDASGQVQIQFVAPSLTAPGFGTDTESRPGDGATGARDRSLATSLPLVVANLRPTDLAALGLALSAHAPERQADGSGNASAQAQDRQGGVAARSPLQESGVLGGARAVREAALPSPTPVTDRLAAEMLATRQAETADAPRTAAAGAHVTFLYDNAAAGAYVLAGSQQASSAAAWQGRSGGSASHEPAIPSLLDLVALEPLLLTYEPGELLVPGTWIPLILPRDESVDAAWRSLD